MMNLATLNELYIQVGFASIFYEIIKYAINSLKLCHVNFKFEFFYMKEIYEIVQFIPESCETDLSTASCKHVLEHI